MGSLAATSSQPVTVSATAGKAVSAPVAVKPVTVAELTPPNKRYQAYAAVQLTALAKDVTVIETDLQHGNIARARQDWLTAQLAWERVGASYDSFGDLGLAVDGLPDGLTRRRQRQGLHRPAPARVRPVARTVRRRTGSRGDPAGEERRRPCGRT